MGIKVDSITRKGAFVTWRGAGNSNIEKFKIIKLIKIIMGEKGTVRAVPFYMSEVGGRDF